MENNLKKCPNCGWEIARAATVCPNCEYNFLNESPLGKKKSPQMLAKTKGMSIIGRYSLIISIIGLLFSLTELGVIFAIIGICLGAYVLFSKKELYYGTAIAGVVISIFALVIFSNTTENSDESKIRNTASSVSENVEVTDFSIDEYEIYDKNGIVLKFTGNKSKSDVSFGFFIENKSKEDITISLSGIAINNISFSENDLSNDIYEKIMSGNKSNFSIDIDVETLTDKGIENVTKVEPMFVLYEGDSDGRQINDVLYTDTDDEEYVEINGGHDVYSDDNFDIMYLGNEGNHFKFSIYNKRGEYLDYYIDKCSINGYSFNLTESETNVFDKPIFPETYSIFEIIIDDDFVYKNSIDDVEKIEFKMYADSDATTFTTGSDIKTKKITVEFEK